MADNALPPECTCQTPGSKNDLAEMFVERMHRESSRKVLVRTHYYRKSCPVHGATGVDGFFYREIKTDEN